MVFVDSNDSLTSPVLAGIALATATVAALLAWRWGRKAWTWVLLSALTLPIILSAIGAGMLYQTAAHNGAAAGFVVHPFRLIFAIGGPSALVGFGAALVFRRYQSNVR